MCAFVCWRVVAVKLAAVQFSTVRARAMRKDTVLRMRGLRVRYFSYAHGGRRGNWAHASSVCVDDKDLHLCFCLMKLLVLPSRGVSLVPRRIPLVLLWLYRRGVLESCSQLFERNTASGATMSSSAFSHRLPPFGSAPRHRIRFCSATWCAVKNMLRSRCETLVVGRSRKRRGSRQMETWFPQRDLPRGYRWTDS